jgi:hypothetical protein
MILTPLKIQVAIIKAFYSLALKSVKYYGGLAVGINNTCLFKEIRLLRAYIDILRNFKIVGSTITCHCCVEGNYTVELVNGLEITNSPIQFECNNQGYLVYNNIGYPFTYYYDPSNSLIQIDFTTIEESITFENVEFTSECNITNGQTTSSFIETSTIEVSGAPITVENAYGDWSGTLVILDDNGDPVYSLTIPVAILTQPDEIVNLWNTTYSNTGWLLSYIDGSYIMTTPIDNNPLYTSYSVEFSQYEGPTTDAFGTRTITFEFEPNYIPAEVTQLIPTTQFSGVAAQTDEFEIPDSFLTVDGTVITAFYLGFPITDTTAPITLPVFITFFNESNTQGFIMEAGPSGGNNVIVKAPIGSDVYNGESIAFDNEVDSIIFESFAGGALPISGNIIVTDDTLGVVYFKNSSSFVTVQDYIDDFNEFNTAGMSCQFAFISGSNTAVTYRAPSNTGFAYNSTFLSYDFFGTGYNYVSNWQLGSDPTTGKLTVNLLNIFNGLVSTLYVDSTSQYYPNYSAIVAALNNSSVNLGFSNTSSVDRFQFFSPEDSFAFYNTYKIQILFDYDSEQYSDIDEKTILSNGVDPTLVVYSKPFLNNYTIGDFVNDNPCEETTAEQECLTNNDVNKIIAHINKLVK